jgi:hypothetical protein
MKIKYLAFVFCGSFIFSSCVSTKDFTSAALEKVKPMMMSTPMKNADYLKLDTLGTPIQKEQVTTKRTKAYFVPLILFWSGGETTQTEINNQYFINLFSEALYDRDKFYDLKEKLDGRILEITLTKLPNLYEYQSRWYFYFAITAYGGGTLQRFYSAIPNLEAMYVIKKPDGTELKSGKVSVENKNIMYGGSGSENGLAKRYFQNLENEFYNQSSNLLEQIIKKL